jgi:two-component system, chemotaxis family, CheB/CheR fusion protein
VKQPERRFSQLVVIGSSAGGVESISVLVSTLPREFPAPIIVAQHLSPSRFSALVEILARKSPLQVRGIRTREPLEPGVIYVAPPNSHVEVTDHEVSLHSDGTGPQPSIDLLFRSAAAVFGENVIAVVLSGTGSDGASGARMVKFAGGTVIIQNPETAAYPGMPLALAPSVVDIVANRERIAEVLNDLMGGGLVLPPATERSPLQSFLDEVREESGVDFTTYKQPTIERRIQRRMVATGQESFADYVRYVHDRPEERQRLINSMLIKVTEFFRDPDLFAYLRSHVLPEIVHEARERGGDLRIWSAGCATGEEAYSLAMTVLDAVQAEGGGVNVRIFATDLDGEAIAFARRGIYPPGVVLDLPPEQIERYFVARGSDYEVRKSLRSVLVFGEHDLGQRSPFPRIDLILCRNVLIYFTAVLQRRALQLFAYSLRPGGYLVLGKSESVGPLAEFFAMDQPRLKVFRRVGDRAIIPPSRIRATMPVTLGLPSSPKLPTPAFAGRGGRLMREMSRSRSIWYSEDLLLGVPFGVVVIDQHYDIQFINGEARAKRAGCLASTMRRWIRI